MNRIAATDQLQKAAKARPDLTIRKKSGIDQNRIAA
jgi:hypothetical protein